MNIDREVAETMLRSGVEATRRRERIEAGGVVVALIALCWSDWPGLPSPYWPFWPQFWEPVLTVLVGCFVGFFVFAMAASLLKPVMRAVNDWAMGELLGVRSIRC